MATLQFTTVKFSKFNAREFARIADMPEDLVRVWRSRGHIQAEGRGAAYPANALAEAMLRHDLARHGIPPSESVDVGQDGAAKILALVMINYPVVCEVVGPAEAVSWLKQKYQSAGSLTDVLYGADVKDQLLVRLDGGLLRSMPAGAAELQKPGYRSALVFNLEGYAARLAEMAGKPVMSFEFECRPGQEMVHTTLAEA